GWIGGGHTEFRAAADLECAPDCAGLGPGELTSPRGIALDAGGNVWVIDEGAGGRVLRFSDTGQLRHTFLPGYQPGGIAIDDEGSLWITDAATGTLYRYQ